jgi:hypothetical protein
MEFSVKVKVCSHEEVNIWHNFELFDVCQGVGNFGKATQAFEFVELNIAILLDCCYQADLLVFNVCSSLMKLKCLKLEY